MTKRKPAKKPSRKKQSTKRSPKKRSDATPDAQPGDLIDRRNYEFLAPVLNKESTRKRLGKVCQVFVKADEDGKVFCFRYAGATNPGVVSLVFYAHGLADWSIDTAHRILREVKTEIRQHETNQGANGDDATNAEYEARVEPTAGLLIPHFIEMLEGKMFSLLGEAELEAECFLKSIYLKIAGISSYTHHIEALAKEMAAERKRYLRKAVDRFGSPNWENLKPLYDDLLPKADQARDLYEHSKQNPNWRAIIKAGFPEFEEDQVALLDKHADITHLPEQAQEAAAKEDYSQPANMALEAAARLCGMENFKLGPRRIRELMKNSTDGRELRHQKHRAAVMRALEENKPTESDTVH